MARLEIRPGLNPYPLRTPMIIDLVDPIENLVKAIAYLLFRGHLPPQ
ncbi:hypothetical protein GFS60_02534 [Rhodococcus sp. WAY2]|nr:hypothetical protein GFS60_02534 [Rhodococcus sp. WAY2]